MKPTEMLASQVRRYRSRKGFNKTELARRAGIEYQTFLGMESGRIRFYPDALLRVQIALGVPIEMLWPFRVGEEGARVTPELLREALDSASERLVWVPTIRDVLDAVCMVFGVPLEDLADTGKQANGVSYARTAAGLIVRNTEGLKLRTLAERLNMHESALSYACSNALCLSPESRLLRGYRTAEKMVWAEE